MIRRRVLLGALLGALFALGWWVGGGRAASGLYSGLDLFVEVLQAVQTNYVDAVDTGKLMAGAMRGVAHGLDPWSRYLDPDEAKAARAAAPGAFDGIGAAVDVRGGWPVVIAPVEGSPAWDAGLEAGDVITKVNGRSMFGLTPDEVGAKLRGGTSAEVALTVARDDKERDLRLPRRRAGVKNVPYAFIATPGVGYLRIAQFSSHAGDDVAAACDTLRRKGARALLMDLRGTPGGALDEAVATAAQFLPTGATIVSTKGRASGTDQRFRATRPRPELAWPLAVLVDGGSASAAEVVAGALQDHDRAVLVGDTTFGLGVVQQIYPLPGTLGALELTAARYFTPSGRSIHRDRGSAFEDDTDDEEGPGGLGPAKPDSARARAFRTEAGRIVRGGGGLAPDVRAAASTEPSAERGRPGGDRADLLAAAREALPHDPAYVRALDVVKRASDARGVFAAAGLKLPGSAGAARR